MWLIIKDLIVVVLYTLLLTGAGLFVLCKLPRTISSGYSWCSFKPLAVLACAVVVCLYEGFCFIGALRLNKRIAQVEARIAAADPEALVADDLEAVGEWTDRFPAVSRAIERFAEKSRAAAEPVRSAGAWMGELRGSVRGYAWRRFAWLCGVLLACGFVLVQDASAQQRRRAAAMRMMADME